MQTRVAIVGVGRWGRNLLREFDARAQVAVCCNKRSREAQAWVNEHYPRVATTFDYGRVLNDESIQAVVIATPIATHASLALRALEAGKHVFVEKPMADRVEDARALVESAREKSLVLFVGYVFLYHPAFQRLMALALNDPVTSARMSWHKFGTFEEDLVWNLVSHELSLALTLFGGTPAVSQTVHRQRGVTGQDFISLQLEFGDGRDCLIQVDRSAPATRKSMTVVTASGRTYVWQGNTLYNMDRNEGPQVVPQAAGEPLGLEVEAFLHCAQAAIAGAEPDWQSAELAFETTKAGARLADRVAERPRIQQRDITAQRIQPVRT